MAKSKRNGRGLWTKAEIGLLKKLFPNTPTAKIAKKLNRKTDAVKKKASRLRLCKSKQYLKTLGRS